VWLDNSTAALTFFLFSKLFFIFKNVGKVQSGVWGETPADNDFGAI